MPRPTRLRGGQLSYHVIGRCNNEEFLFRSEIDFALYMECLQKAKDKYPFELNNFTLMSNHIHLILTTQDGIDIDKIIHSAHLLFTKSYNQRHGRRGHFWRDRYKSLVIHDDLYGLACMRYIHRNPVRAGIVKKPEDWPWSAYRFYAFGAPMPSITPFPPYLALDECPVRRTNIYRSFVEEETDREKDERRIFSGRLKLNSRRFQQLFHRACSPLLAKTFTW